MGAGLTARQRAQRELVWLEAAEMPGLRARPPEVVRRLQISQKSAYAWHARWRRQPRPRGGGRRRYGNREVLAAIVFVATSGCI